MWYNLTAGLSQSGGSMCPWLSKILSSCVTYLWGKGVWWLLSDFLVVPSQQYRFWLNIDYMFACHRAYFIGLCEWLMVWHYFTGLSKIKTAVSAQALNSHQTLFLMRGWDLSVRLFCCCYGTLPSAMLIILQTSVLLFQSWYMNLVCCFTNHGITYNVTIIHVPHNVMWHHVVIYCVRTLHSTCAYLLASESWKDIGLVLKLTMKLLGYRVKSEPVHFIFKSTHTHHT